MTKPLVFRVSGIPLRATKSEVMSVISSKFPNNKLHTEECDIVPSCNNEAQTALIQFLNDPPKELLEELSSGYHFEIRYKEGEVEYISIDKDFYGLTQLYTPKYKIEADIVAVSGLNSHPYGSWRSRGRLHQMWLRHFFPISFPSCRTMIFGCNTSLTEGGLHTTSDYADSLLEELRKVRRTQEELERPIVFIGHSFGGVVIAQAFVKANEHSSHHSQISKSTRAIVFFGTPHRGLSIDDLQGMVPEDSPRESLLKSLNAGNIEMKKELDKFKKCCGHIKISSFYEGKQTPAVIKNPDGGHLSAGELSTRVERSSSLLYLPGSVEKTCMVNANHSEMVKFNNRNDVTYTTVVADLEDYLGTRRHSSCTIESPETDSNTEPVSINRGIAPQPAAYEKGPRGIKRRISSDRGYQAMERLLIMAQDLGGRRLIWEADEGVDMVIEEGRVSFTIRTTSKSTVAPFTEVFLHKWGRFVPRKRHRGEDEEVVVDNAAKSPVV